MQDFGQLLLLVSFFVTLVTALTAIAGAVSRNDALMRGARWGAYGVAWLAVAMAIVLTHGFLTHDFSNKYIATYSDRSMPTLYLLASFWGGEKGALLFWVTSLAIFSAIAIHTNRERAPVYMAWVTAVLMLCLFFFNVLMVFESSPFETFATSGGPTDGKGLNPLLQNPTMAFHPPSLLTGYITFTIPFAFGAAALVTGKLDDQWITDTRRWSIVSWAFLSVGLLLGALWAYQEIGWGFWWMWDPVENAGLIPWFTGTAFLHSVMIQERYGMLKRWNAVLVCLTFLLTIFGTFLTRSQLIDSIHAFADSTLAEYFIGYMIVLAIVSVILIAWRWKALEGEARIESFLSRESFFVLNNVFLVGCAFIVLWGTLFPKISEAESVRAIYNQVAGGWNASLGLVLGELDLLTQAVSLDEPWFNRVMAPIGLVLLFLMGVGPLISWRRATAKNFERNFRRPLAGSLVITAIGAAVWSFFSIRRIADLYELTMGQAYDNWADSLVLADVYTVLCYLFCVFVGWTIAREFHIGARVREGKGDDGYLASVLALTFKNPRRYGGYIIHFGVMLMFVGFTGKVFKSEDPERLIAVGEELPARDYRLTFSDRTQAWDPDGGFAALRATFTIMHEGETVADREVNDTVAWLQTRLTVPFHVETRLDSPKIRVRVADVDARDRLRDDLWLAQDFRDHFALVADGGARLTYRLQDDGLLRVMPMLAMQALREARVALGPGSTIGARVELTPGSTELALTFDAPAAAAAFQQRVAQATVPDTLLHGGFDPDSGAIELIDRRTGTHLVPEVRYYAKHETPTTEAGISSLPWEDLYLAIRPRMDMGTIAGFAQPSVNLLTVVFPLVSLLWLGGITLVFGTIICLTPRWLSRTLIAMTRSRRRLPVAEAAALALTAALAALALTAAPPAHAHGDALPEPRGMAAPPDGDAVGDALAALSCGPAGTTEAMRVLPLGDPGCASPKAEQDRALVTELVRKRPEADQRSGRAKLDVLYELVALDQRWDERLRYDTAAYDHLKTTTKTTCPGERGLVLSQSQLACTVRNKWLPRFRVMLAAGVPAEQVFRFYVDENNVTSAEGEPWTYDDLRAHPDKALSWAFPAALIAGFAAAFIVLMVRVGRRRRLAAASPGQHVGSDRQAQGQRAGALSDAQRARLDDELEAFEGS